jgi:hypothetical protein
MPKGGYRHGDLVIYPPTSTQDGSQSCQNDNVDFFARHALRRPKLCPCDPAVFEPIYHRRLRDEVGILEASHLQPDFR